MRQTKLEKTLIELKQLKSKIRKIETSLKKKKPRIYRYECYNVSSYKFWEIRKTSNGYIASWGKIGHPAQGKKFYGSREIRSKIDEKLRKGYFKTN